MTLQKFIWKGPPTTIEVWATAGTGEPELSYSGPVAPGLEIPQSLDGENPQVKSWINFGLIAPVEATAEQPAKSRNSVSLPRPQKENSDG